MRVLDWIVLALVAVLFGLALRHTLKRKKCGCGGCCSGCSHVGSCPMGRMGKTLSEKTRKGRENDPCPDDCDQTLCN